MLYEGDVNNWQERLKLKKEGYSSVSGRFNCSQNSLETLEGAPKKVGGGFYCSNNELETLEGAPEEVGGSFDCSRNSLETLEGSPKKVGGSFDCGDNKLETLEGAPKKVGGVFNCDYNKLLSLGKGLSRKIIGTIQASNHEIKQSKPIEVSRNFFYSFIIIVILACFVYSISINLFWQFLSYSYLLFLFCWLGFLFINCLVGLVETIGRYFNNYTIVKKILKEEKNIKTIIGIVSIVANVVGYSLIWVLYLSKR